MFGLEVWNDKGGVIWNDFLNVQQSMGDVDRTRMILAEGFTTKVAAWKNIYKIRQNSLKKDFSNNLEEYQDLWLKKFMGQK